MKNYYHHATRFEIISAKAGALKEIVVRGFPDPGDLVHMKESLVQDDDEGLIALYAQDLDIAGPWDDGWLYSVVHAVACPARFVRFHYRVDEVIYWIEDKGRVCKVTQVPG